MEDLKIALKLNCCAGFGTAKTSANDFVDSAGHIWTEIISWHGAIHRTLSRVTPKKEEDVTC